MTLNSVLLLLSFIRTAHFFSFSFDLQPACVTVEIFIFKMKFKNTPNKVQSKKRTPTFKIQLKSKSSFKMRFKKTSNKVQSKKRTPTLKMGYKKKPNKVQYKKISLLPLPPKWIF